ncbi:hypothetical protein BIU96_09865 [Curtobacterium sp. MCBA15_008]|nr:hypothetical protein BIU96_09865 [Curtobacterium sp. MCBA15_008]
MYATLPVIRKGSSDRGLLPWERRPAMAKHRHRCGDRRRLVVVLEVLGLTTAIVSLVAAILQLS